MSKPSITQDNLAFINALLDWIIFDCQSFTVTESEWFRRMLKAGGVIEFIPKGDAITNKIIAKLAIAEKETTLLLAKSCSIIVISLDC
jgi:hypothetical protein